MGEMREGGGECYRDGFENAVLGIQREIQV